MRHRTMKGLAAFAALAAIAIVSLPSASHAQDATWDRIQKRGTVVQSCVLQPPYWSRSVDNKWKGWGITAADKLAEDLKVKAECKESTWGTAALDIQSNKIDLMWAMQATPIRATAITFAGPLYNHGFMAVNNKSFNGKSWADYDKPSVRLAVQGGTSNALVRRIVAPNATALEMKDNQDVILSVVAGRADAMLMTVLNGVYAKDKFPDLGSFVIPQPLFSFPAYVGIPNEVDHRFSDFMHWWAEWYRLQGDVEKWIRDSLIEVGVKPENIPDKLYF